MFELYVQRLMTKMCVKTKAEWSGMWDSFSVASISSMFFLYSNICSNKQVKLVAGIRYKVKVDYNIIATKWCDKK